MYVSMVLHRIN